jgi:hypothetical protein
MSKWTPGPWQMSPYNYTEVLMAEGIGAECYYVKNEDEEQSQANAKLIAAAPELYEAADALSRLFNELLFDMSKVTQGEQDAMKAAWERLDAALAKARGEV